MEKIIQIAYSESQGNEDLFFALTDKGRIYERTYHREFIDKQKGFSHENLKHFYTWEEVELPKF